MWIIYYTIYSLFSASLLQSSVSWFFRNQYIYWFTAQETFIIIINVRTVLYFWKRGFNFYFQISLMKEQALFEI